MPKKKSASKSAPASASASEGGSSKATTTTNKSAFIRDLPANLPAKEVVERAKAAGLKMSVAYVYSIRTAAKANARKSGGSAPPAAPRGRVAIAVNGHASGGGKVEDLLRAVAAEIGLSRAIGLLQSEQQKVRAVIGG
jgi:hypothetical protein